MPVAQRMRLVKGVDPLASLVVGVEELVVVKASVDLMVAGDVKNTDSMLALLAQVRRV